MARKLFLDFHDTIVNSSEIWEEVKHHIYSKQGKLYVPDSTFEKLKFYDNAREIISEISRKTEVHIVSIDSYYMIGHIAEYLEKALPFVSYQPILSNQYQDKSHIDMRNSVFIDHSVDNLMTSSAEDKIRFKYKDFPLEQHKIWTGKTLTAWDNDTYEYLKELLEIE